MSVLTRDPIALDSLLRVTSSAERGGTCVFVGTVRGDAGVTEIEYSGYDPMVDAEVARILTEVSERWPDARVAIRHRLGIVPVGEASIAIVSAAPHREAAFASCRYVIEAVKLRVPIWKKERRADGTAAWVDARVQPVHARPR